MTGNGGRDFPSWIVKEGKFYLKWVIWKMKKNIQSPALPKSENITEIKIQEECYSIEDLKNFTNISEGVNTSTIWWNYLIAK